MNKQKIIYSLLSIFFSLFFFANAQQSQNKGYEIVKKMLDYNDGIKSSENHITMLLKNKSGAVSKREIEAKGMTNSANTTKSLLTFKSPSDVKGTAFLSHTQEGENQSNQWIYLPASDRIKRISSSTDKKSAFMSSEFTYEDLSPTKLEDYNFKYLGDKVFNGANCYVVKSESKDPKSSQYKYTLTLYNKNLNNRIEAVVFYDKAGKKLKTLTQSNFVKHEKKYFLPGKMFMYNHQTKKSTTLLMTDYKINSSLEESYFSVSSLKG